MSADELRAALEHMVAQDADRWSDHATDLLRALDRIDAVVMRAPGVGLERLREDAVDVLGAMALRLGIVRGSAREG